jgi:hypothetical protein
MLYYHRLTGRVLDLWRPGAIYPQSTLTKLMPLDMIMLGEGTENLPVSSSVCDR